MARNTLYQQRRRGTLPVALNTVQSDFGPVMNLRAIRLHWPEFLETEVQMSEYNSNYTSGWIKFMTLPAKLHENGNLIIRGASFTQVMGTSCKLALKG